MKRCLDIVIAATGLLIALPVMAVVALLVALNLGRPVLFRQHRPGLHGELFEMIKFRTMRNACDSAGQALPDAQRLTRFGIWLRRTSLDELPELWNVLSGDMSLDHMQVVLLVALVHFLFVLSAIGISYSERLTRDKH